MNSTAVINRLKTSRRELDNLYQTVRLSTLAASAWRNKVYSSLDDETADIIDSLPLYLEHISDCLINIVSMNDEIIETITDSEVSG